MFYGQKVVFINSVFVFILVSSHRQLFSSTVGRTPVFGWWTDPVIRSACS